jgi:dolichol-phosphate mannosyltransferase
MRDALIVLPSYNERDNVVALAEALLALDAGIHVCVVDDQSPDGTSALMAATITERGWQSRVHLITRSKKDGRGGAVRDGFQWGKETKRAFTAYVEMDCDFSHQPEAVLTGLRLLEEGNDVAIGARYPNGTFEGWPLGRRVLSFFANQLARTLIDRRIPDYTGGFRFYSARAIEVMLSNRQRNKGYIYLSEQLSLLLNAGMRVATFPIHFKNRERGVSSTSPREVAAALYGIFTIAWRHRTSR